VAVLQRRVRPNRLAANGWEDDGLRKKRDGEALRGGCRGVDGGFRLVGGEGRRFPAVSSDNLPPATEQTVVAVEEKVTASPELAVADRVSCVNGYCLPVMGGEADGLDCFGDREALPDGRRGRRRCFRPGCVKHAGSCREQRQLAARDRADRGCGGGEGHRQPDVGGGREGLTRQGVLRPGDRREADGLDGAPNGKALRDSPRGINAVAGLRA